MTHRSVGPPLTSRLDERGFFAARRTYFRGGTHLSLVRTVNLHYTYNVDSDTPIVALRGIEVQIEAGEHVAIVGRNGSGKSTLAKCMAGLLWPTQGEVWVKEWDTRAESTLYDVRATVGIVFQNPDNQFVTTVVEEEVAFGPENLGIPHPELRERVDRALLDTGLEDLHRRDPHYLSASQKARLAIACILAMRPACLVLDESTAMLDPASRDDILGLVGRLHGDGLTVVSITHLMDEALMAERMLIMNEGQIAFEGSPRQVFGRAEELEEMGLALPPAADLARRLRHRGIALPEGILAATDLIEAVTAAWENRR